MQEFIDIRDVWDCNLNEEMLFINKLLSKYTFVAFDTEFPGFLFSSPKTASEFERYAALVSNVNRLKLIQLGIVLFNEHGIIGGCWQFNFSEFDVGCDPHVPESIALLERNGIDFEKNRKEGVRYDRFVEAFNPVLSGHPMIKWVTFHGAYDVGYLSRLLLNKKVPPSNYKLFGNMVVDALGGTLFDVKLMAEFLLGQDGFMGLEKLAQKLSVTRVGEAHQAGSDALLTAQVFIKISQGAYIQLQKTFGGYLFGVNFRFGYGLSRVQRQRHQQYDLQQHHIPSGIRYCFPQAKFVVISPLPSHFIRVPVFRPILM